MYASTTDGASHILLLLVPQTMLHKLAVGIHHASILSSGCSEWSIFDRGNKSTQLPTII